MIDPVFTLSWPEAVVANAINRLLPKTKGYSVWVPTSRQQAGVDLVVGRLHQDKRRIITIQVKASRIYVKGQRSRFRYDTWFNNFKIAPEADFVALFWFCPPDVRTASKISRRKHQYFILLPKRSELEKLLKRCRTKAGDRDTKFGLGFTNDSLIGWTRGNQCGDETNYAKWLLSSQRQSLIESLT